MIKITHDGRTIRSGASYTIFRRQLHASQGGNCLHCGGWVFLDLPPEDLASFHVHHKNGRGLGGSKRDDTFEACIGLCRGCHDKFHEEKNNGWSHAAATNSR